MEERRREPRLRSLLGGKIALNARQSAFDCTVRNVSSHGAMIKFADMFRMPQEFDFNIPQHDETRHATVIWRRHDGAGLALTPVEPAAAVKVAAAKVEEPQRKMWLQGTRPREKKGMVLGY